MDVRGHCASGLEPVRDAFARPQANDSGGAQLCVYRRGEIVLDLWIGRERASGPTYEADTPTVVMSVTKAAVAVCAHMLAERGALDLDAPVADCWPEFAAAGKGEITTAQLLAHSAGLPGFPQVSAIGVEDLRDWRACTTALAEAPPLWEPGTACLYHPITHGYLLGEVVRRASRRSIGQFLADEVAGPLDLDLWIGLPEREQHRVAAHFRPSPPGDAAHWRGVAAGFGVDVDHPLVETVVEAYVLTDALIEAMKTPAMRAAEIPAGNGVGTARSMAKMLAACIGEVDGARLMSAETVQRARTPQTDEIFAPEPFPAAPKGAAQRFGLGFELPRTIMPMLGPGSFGHCGAGGRVAYADPEAEVAVAYVCNNMLWDGATADPRWIWNDALREVLHREVSTPELATAAQGG